MRAKLILIVVLVTVSGCGTSGPLYSEIVSTIPALESGKSRLIVYRKWAWKAGLGDAYVRVNEDIEIALPTDTFTYLDVTPGLNAMSVEVWADLGTFLMSGTFKKDREYYFRVRPAKVDSWPYSEPIANFTPLLWGGWKRKVDEAAPAFKEAELNVIEHTGVFMLIPVSKNVAMKNLAETVFVPYAPQ